MPPAAADETLRFDHFELHPAERVLRVRGEAVPLGSRAFDLLLALAQRHERLVTKQELLDLVWPGLVVEEHNIATQIGNLRKLLGASAITTLPGYGYRLTAARPATASPTAAATSALTQRPRHNLPEPRTRFIGREAALADLAAPAVVDAAADADRHRRLRQDAPGAALRATATRCLRRRGVVRRPGAAEGSRARDGPVRCRARHPRRG